VHLVGFTIEIHNMVKQVARKHTTRFSMRPANETQYGH